MELDRRQDQQPKIYDACGNGFHDFPHFGEYADTKNRMLQRAAVEQIEDLGEDKDIDRDGAAALDRETAQFGQLEETEPAQ